MKNVEFVHWPRTLTASRRSPEPAETRISAFLGLKSIAVNPPHHPLKARLDALVKAYGPAHLSGDPLSLVRPYQDPRDREVAGLIASALAFGNVKQVLRSVKLVLAALGERPSRGLAHPGLAARLEGFRHRWVGEEEVLLYLHVLHRILEQSGSVEKFFASGWNPEGGLRAAVSSFSQRARALAGGPEPLGRSFLHLLPDPATGCAAKRPCLFLRWMVRPDDGLDLGVWTCLLPADLVIPLDTHVLRISRYIGLTERKTAGWATAEEITRSLRSLDPGDPVAYDFALAQLGISRDCLHRRVPERCGACPLEEICRL